jgi:hypothetical protein
MHFDAVLMHLTRTPRVGCSCQQRATTGAVERANPLPAGRYWVDVFAPDAEAFGAWLSANRATVRIRTTEHYDSTPPRDWYLFEVTAPTSWQGPGLPTIAASNVTSSSDTAVRPDPVPSLATQVEQQVESASSALGPFAKGLVGVLAAAFVIEVGVGAFRKGGAVTRSARR